MFFVCWWYTPDLAPDLRQRVETSSARLSRSAPGPDLDEWYVVLASGPPEPRQTWQSIQQDNRRLPLGMGGRGRVGASARRRHTQGWEVW